MANSEEEFRTGMGQLTPELRNRARNAGLAQPSSESVSNAEDALRDALQQLPPTGAPGVVQPHGSDGDEHLFTPASAAAGGAPEHAALEPYAAALLHRVSPRLRGPIPRDVALALEYDDAAGHRGAARPVDTSTSAGAALVRRALRHIMLNNTTETRDEMNLRRANDVDLQNVLDILGAHDFASPRDRIAWREEWTRQSLAWAPKDPRNRHSAA